MLKVGTQTILNWEKGKVAIPAFQLERLVEIYQIPIGNIRIKRAAQLRTNELCSKNSNYFFLLGVCDKAEPATDLEAELVRLSRRILEAVDATLFEVSLLAIDTSFRRF